MRKRIRIQELRPSKQQFRGRGIAHLKVTTYDDDGNEVVQCVEIPISTERVRKVYQEFESKAPQPPVQERLVQPSEPIGRELSLIKPTVVMIPNLADAKYRKHREEFEEERAWAIAAAAIDVPLFILDDGVPEGERPAKTLGEKITALKQLGLQGPHILDIVETITRLCSWDEEERLRFFSRS